MKNLNYVFILLLLLSCRSVMFGQEDACVLKITYPGWSGGNIKSKLVINKYDTLQTDLGGFAKAHVVCKLKSIQFLSLDIEDNQLSETRKYEFDYAYKENDTVYIYLKEEFKSNKSLNKKFDHLPTNKKSVQELFEMEPGIRWETRGLDGSAFLNVRGSGYRSSYGVGNVKFYSQGLPITLPDGSTQFEFIEPYFNTLSFSYYNQNYGTGNGGAMYANLREDSIIGSPSLEFSTQILLGSFGYRSYGGQFSFKNKKLSVRGGFIQKESKGYRELEFLNRKNAFLQTTYKINDKNGLELNVNYAYNKWGLPGAQNINDWTNNPKQANAYSKNILAHLEKNQLKAGLTHQYASKKYRNNSIIFGGWNSSFNPYGTSINNNGIKKDDGFNLGFIHNGNLNFYSKNEKEYDWFYGIENQEQLLKFSERAISDSSLKVAGDLVLSQTFVNTGFKFSIRNKHIVRLFGQVIMNYFDYKNVHKSNSITGSGNLEYRYFGSRLKQVVFNIGQSVSQPTWSEIINSDGSINALKPEKRAFVSLSFPLFDSDKFGIKHEFLPEYYTWVYYDFITPYNYNNTDVIKFKNFGLAVNSGLNLKYNLNYSQPHRILKNWGIDFIGIYGIQLYVLPFIELNNNELVPVKILPGIPLNTCAANIKFQLFRFELSFQAIFNDKIYTANDNNDYQKAYVVLNAELSYRQPLFTVLELDLFIAGRNLTSSKYSNRLNYNDAYNRYYNAAPPINFMFGLNIRTKNMLKTKAHRIKF